MVTRSTVVAEKKRKGFIRLPKKGYARGDVVPVSAIYECSECENITAYRKGEVFGICDSCNAEGDAHWLRTNEVLHFVSKNLNTEFERVETVGLKAADYIADYSGRVSFVVFHIIWFWVWIHANTGGSVFGYHDWDTYPFGLLTMIVSLEAIILSTFILISQNRQSQKSELRAELDYQVNLKTEKDVAEILAILKDLRTEEQLLNRKATEILEDTSQIVEEVEEEQRRKRAPKRAKRGKDIIKEAGIDHVEHGD